MESVTKTDAMEMVFQVCLEMGIYSFSDYNELCKTIEKKIEEIKKGGD